MVYKNGFVKSQLTVSQSEQLTVGLNGVIMSGVSMEADATALLKGIVLNQRGDTALRTTNGDRWDIAIEATATVVGDRMGLYLDGSRGTLSNAGRVAADRIAVYFDGRNHSFSNSGSVEGELGIYFAEGSLVNEVGGTIVGEQVGISTYGTITNFGTITGGVAIRLNGAGTELVNKGEIFGNIVVNSSDVVLDMRGGQLSGVIRTGSNSTTVIVDDSELRFVASAGQATVKASVDYALGNGVERLVLTGVADTAGRGNSDSNMLVGNVGSNTLHGMQGQDRLDGGKGDDTLTGGADRDTFVFAVGDGHDIITDFQNSRSGGESDWIELGDGLAPSWRDRDTFLDDHVRNDGQGNVIIEFDGQSITLLGLRKADLSLEDFGL